MKKKQKSIHNNFKENSRQLNYRPMYNDPSVNVTDGPFVNVVEYQHILSHFFISLFELKLGQYSVYLP